MTPKKNDSPIQYQTKTAYFWDDEFFVSPDVLIPRQDTERLIDAILLHYPKNTHFSCLELGTGSGVIAITLAKIFPNILLTATDKSEKALAVAKKNAKRLEVNTITFKISDWFEKLTAEKFDLIVSNPPYLSKTDPAIAENVIAHEPHEALFAEEDGLADLRYLINTSKQYLQPQGRLLLEHGYQQGAAVRKIFEDAAYTQIATHRDFGGHERCTEGVWISH
jgi:release factor glutamine methyltransferase